MEIFKNGSYIVYNKNLLTNKTCNVIEIGFAGLYEKNFTVQKEIY